MPKQFPWEIPAGDSELTERERDLAQRQTYTDQCREVGLLPRQKAVPGPDQVLARARRLEEWAQQAQLEEWADEMRRHPTETERLLWGKLRNKRMGCFFVRQQIVLHRYIIDFYAPFKKVAVEVDGADFHSTPAQLRYDRSRDRALAMMAIKTLRVPAADVLGDMPAVLGRIRVALRDAGLRTGARR